MYSGQWLHKNLSIKILFKNFKKWLTCYFSMYLDVWLKAHIGKTYNNMTVENIN